VGTNRVSHSDTLKVVKIIFLCRIDHWDFEKERLVAISDHNIISTWYNFRYGQVEEIKLIPLKFITEVIAGKFTYPSMALVW